VKSVHLVSNAHLDPIWLWESEWARPRRSARSASPPTSARSSIRSSSTTRVGGVEQVRPGAGRPIVLNDNADPWGMRVRGFRHVAGRFRPPRMLRGSANPWFHSYHRKYVRFCKTEVPQWTAVVGRPEHRPAGAGILLRRFRGRDRIRKEAVGTIDSGRAARAAAGLNR